MPAFEQGLNPLVIVHRAGEDEAVDGAAPHDLLIGVGFALTGMWGEDVDVHAGGGGPLGHLVEESVEGEPVTSGRDAVPDGEGATLGEGPGGAIRAIAEPVGGLDHPAPGLLSDPLRCVECVGDCGDGHSGCPTHVLDRGSRAHAKNVLRRP